MQPLLKSTSIRVWPSEKGSPNLPAHFGDFRVYSNTCLSFSLPRVPKSIFLSPYWHLYLFDSCDSDDKEEREAAGHRASRGVHYHLQRGKNVLLTTGFQAAEETKTLVTGEKGCSAPWGEVTAQQRREGRKGHTRRTGTDIPRSALLHLEKTTIPPPEDRGMSSGGKNLIRSSLKPKFALMGSKSLDEWAAGDGLHKHNYSKCGCQQACSHHGTCWRQGRRMGQKQQQRMKWKTPSFLTEPWEGCFSSLAVRMGHIWTLKHGWLWEGGQYQSSRTTDT